MFASIGVNAQKFITANVADALMACSAASMTNGANSSSSSQRGGGSSDRNSAETILKGDFVYKGAVYGFLLKIYYSPSNGKIKSVYYAPKATGKYSKILGTGWITTNEIYIDGKTADGVITEISAESYGGLNLSGSMRRGNHYGTCVIYMY